MKLCSKCGETKAIDDFYKCAPYPDGHEGHCKICSSVRTTEYRLKYPERQFLYQAKLRAKDKNVPFNLIEDDIVIPEPCPVLGIPLRKNVGKPKDDSPTLDRLVQELGYVRGNVHIISFRANKLKNDATPDELDAVARYARQGCIG